MVSRDKSKPIPGPHLVYGFLTTAPNAIVEPPAHRKRRSIGPLIALFVPGYFLRPSPTRQSRSAHRSSTLVSIRASNSSAETVGIPARCRSRISLLPVDLAAHMFDFSAHGGEMHCHLQRRQGYDPPVLRRFVRCLPLPRSAGALHQ
jgi:hypothetical protein